MTVSENEGLASGRATHEQSQQAVSAVPVGIPDADDYYDCSDDTCYECGGEGFVSSCVEEWACVDPEYGCDYCTHRCPLCAPKPDPVLQQVLAEHLAQGMEARKGGDEGSVHDSPVHAPETGLENSRVTD